MKPRTCHSEYLQRSWPLSPIYQKQLDLLMLFLESVSEAPSRRGLGNLLLLFLIQKRIPRCTRDDMLGAFIGVFMQPTYQD